VANIPIIPGVPTPASGDPKCALTLCGRIIAQVDCIKVIMQGTSACIDIQFFGKDSKPTSGYSFGFLSDDRLKHNEINIVNGLEIIRKLNPQKYQKTKNFKQSDFSGIVNEPYIIESGLIAQDVYKINDISYTVTVGDEIKPYYLNYNDLFVYTIAGLKELDSFVQKIPEYTSVKNLENIETILTNQNNIIQKLNAKISLLENKIYLLERK